MKSNNNMLPLAGGGETVKNGQLMPSVDNTVDNPSICKGSNQVLINEALTRKQQLVLQRTKGYLFLNRSSAAIPK